METKNWIYSDGGRKEAGFKGTTSDCVVRAICNATNGNYKKVYDYVNSFSKSFEKIKSSSSRTGVTKHTSRVIMEELGFKWKPLMGIGTGCKFHLKAEELPKGIIICKLSRHLTCMKDGIIYDTYDCSRKGTRCVYGYWRLE